jgi:hypothetical protein
MMKLTVGHTLIKPSKILEQELTRKQFILAVVSAVIGLTGISTFLGVFSKNIQPTKSTRPGYGERGFGP